MARPSSIGVTGGPACSSKPDHHPLLGRDAPYSQWPGELGRRRIEAITAEKSGRSSPVLPTILEACTTAVDPQDDPCIIIVMRPMPLVQLENTDWSSSSDLAFYLGK